MIQLHTDKIMIILKYGIGLLLVVGISCSRIKQDGDKTIFYYPNGQVEETGKLVDGKKEGIWKSYYPNGRLKAEDYYVEGKRNGKAVSYYKNGKVATIAHYKGNELSGEFVKYYTSGKKNFQDFFDTSGESGKKLFQLWHENGQLGQEGYKVNGKMDGKWKTYYENGQLKTIEHYKYGVKDSTWVYYSPEGELQKREVYQNDSLIKVTK